MDLVKFTKNVRKYISGSIIEASGSKRHWVQKCDFQEAEKKLSYNLQQQYFDLIFWLY